MGTATEIRRRAWGELVATGGWGASIGGWGVWIAIEFFAKQFLGGLVSPLVAASGSGEGASSSILLVSCLLTAAFYYFRFAKVYGLSALAVSVMRGGPAFRYAFAGFGRGWRAVGVHLWIGWRLLAPSASLLLPMLAACVWTWVEPERSVEALRACGEVWRAHPLAASACGMACVVGLLVPAIVVWYHFRLAYMVLVDHPDWACRAVVDESARLMAGRRSTMFRLDLWFVGATVLLYLPGAVAVLCGVSGLDFPVVQKAAQDILAGRGMEAMQLFESLDELFVALIMLGVFLISIAGLGCTLLVNPYWTAARAAFYESVLDLAEDQTCSEIGEEERREET